MTAINITLPMLQCSSCNSCIAHLMEDYKRMLQRLTKLIDNKHDFNDDLPEENKNDFVSNGKDCYSSFIQKWYLYSDEEDKRLFSDKAVLIYALMDYDGLTPADFPFRKIVKKFRYCCTRMFLCDPTVYL